MSASTQRWPLGKALSVAEKVRAALEPYCKQITIAGSIRRLRPEVGDIDIVLEPRPDCQDAIVERAQRRGKLEANGQDYTRIILPPPGGGSLAVSPGETAGDAASLRAAGGMQLDLWWVKPPPGDFFTNARSKWGMRLLVATGSESHNIKLSLVAKLQGKHFAPYLGICDGGEYRPVTIAGQREPQLRYQGGAIVASATEEEVFAALGLPFVPPEGRHAEMEEIRALRERLRAQEGKPPAPDKFCPRCGRRHGGNDARAYCPQCAREAGPERELPNAE